MVVPIEKEVYIHHDEAYNFNLARVSLDEEKIAWIKRMSDLVKKEEVVHIADYDSSADFFVKDEDEEITPYKGSTECNMIIVRKEGFYWKGLLKHTSIQFETDMIYLDYLEDLIKFYKEEPIKNMPKFINDEDYSKRGIALHRMKGE